MKYAIDAYDDFINGEYNVIRFTKYDEDALRAETSELPVLAHNRKAEFYARIQAEYRQAVLIEVKTKAAECKTEDELKLFINQQHQFAIAYLNSLNSIYKVYQISYHFNPNLPNEVNELINHYIINDLFRIILFIQERWGRYIKPESHFDLKVWAKDDADNEYKVLAETLDLIESLNGNKSEPMSLQTKAPSLSPVAKIKTKLSVPQLGFIFGLLQQKGILQFPSKTAAIDFAVQHFSSGRKENVSSKQARKKSYSLSSKEMIEVVELFKSSYIDSLNGNKKVSKK